MKELAAYLKQHPGVVVLTLALIVTAAGYALNRGLYVGSEVVREGRFYELQCHYLFPSGIRVVNRGSRSTPEQARARSHCSLFYNS